jgi:hypothetical protein
MELFWVYCFLVFLVLCVCSFILYRISKLNPWFALLPFASFALLVFLQSSFWWYCFNANGSSAFCNLFR